MPLNYKISSNNSTETLDIVDNLTLKTDSNYCDGFGWVGRQNDLHRIYDASDFVFNQRNIRVLDEVLDEYY